MCSFHSATVRLSYRVLLMSTADFVGRDDEPMVVLDTYEDWRFAKNVSAAVVDD